MGNEKKKISIGYEDFKEILDNNCYFVDKTLMIKELIESKSKVSLITRPRRFGKTLNQSMIRRFFEDEITEQGDIIDNSYLFKGLNIMDCGDDILKHQGKYPVISLSLKSAKQPNYNMAYKCLIDEICKEFQRHSYVLAKDMSERNRGIFEKIALGIGNADEYAKALAFLSECLARYHGRNVYILIDEYDVPLENSYFAGFYNEMTGFIRSLFESALKTNPYLEKGIITGCLRISKESIFTGLNNLETCSITDVHYSDRFGFTESEVKKLMVYCDLSDKYPEVKEWYDGYKFGDAEIYNPWSIIKYIRTAQSDRNAFPKAYWANTSSNSIVREMIYDADEETRRELEILMDGGYIEKPVHEDITYEDIHSSKDNLWNFLFFTGYLKAGNQRMENRTIYLEMSIPNEEIAYTYEEFIKGWFEEKVENTDRSVLIKALEQGDCEAAEGFINTQLMDTISYFDYAENYYHGFMAGLLKGAGSYNVLSNRESGNGRPDMILTERKFMGRAVIIEFKISDTFKGMEAKCAEALKQIDDMNYAASLEDDGYQEILKYGICFFRKGCMVRK